MSQITHRHHQEHQGYYTLNSCYALLKLAVGPQDHPALVWALSHHTDPMQHEAQGYIKITSCSDSIIYTLRGVYYVRSTELHSAAKHQVFAYYYNESVGRRRCRHHDPRIQRQCSAQLCENCLRPWGNPCITAPILQNWRYILRPKTLCVIMWWGNNNSNKGGVCKPALTQLSAYNCIYTGSFQEFSVLEGCKSALIVGQFERPKLPPKRAHVNTNRERERGVGGGWGWGVFKQKKIYGNNKRDRLRTETKT